MRNQKKRAKNPEKNIVENNNSFLCSLNNVFDIEHTMEKMDVVAQKMVNLIYYAKNRLKKATRDVFLW